jgi:ribosomal protein L11 methyltransferase
LASRPGRPLPQLFCIEKVPGDGQGPVIVPAPKVGGQLRVVPPNAPHATTSGDSSSLDIQLASTIGWGDGHHPTTYLSLAFLADYIPSGEGMTVLDYGTGSGVLAMAARRLGSGRVVGIDIDDEALDAAFENLELNGMSGEEDVVLKHTREVIQDAYGIILRDDARGQTLQFDVVVANILIGPLIKLAPVLSMAVKEGTGALCLCGLRQEQIPDIEEAYSR